MLHISYLLPQFLGGKSQQGETQARINSVPISRGLSQMGVGGWDG